ncbi:EF hand domain-containing protein [Roseibium hamelinense]|uniref:EF hand domain-containing protein n=1 Tax=Roseibium hamelinense TaxID=150831 RepID=A0A562SVP2_9HYPH|nr:hypothetical protein [Roseibium hamelinense]MTI43152.1 hypothetical protein [Roseibium hamelinense]TWI84800.1 EF hand domain-containing protein [Roseibium hamelinense]
MKAAMKACAATAMLAATVSYAFADTQQQMVQANYLASDADGNGVLSFAEFKSLIDLNAQDGIGRFGLIKRTNRYALAFERLDTDGNAVVSPAELKAAAERQ